MDLHMTIPRFESVAGSAMARYAGRKEPARSVEDYEAVLGPLYAMLYRVAQAAATQSLRRRGNVSRRVWSHLNGDSGRRFTRFALARVTVPGAVALLNRAGLGPFDSRVSGESLRDSGLTAMGTVVDGLGIDAAHVVFGHTHRAGPLPADDRSAWRSPAGVRLWNTGAWLHETVLIEGTDSSHPYWPGTVVRIPVQRAPEVVNVLRGAELPALPD
jgi:hypothetical protein